MLSSWRWYPFQMVPFPHVFKLSGPTRLSRSEVDVSIHKCGISVVTPNGGPFSGMPRGVCCILGTLPSSPLSPLKKGFNRYPNAIRGSFCRGVSPLIKTNKSKEQRVEVDTVMTLSWNKWGARSSCLGMRKLRLVALLCFWFCSFSRSFCEYERFIHFFLDIRAGRLAGVFFEEF